MNVYLMGDLHRPRSVVAPNTLRIWKVIRESLAGVGRNAVRWHSSMGGSWPRQYAAAPSGKLLDALRPFVGSLVLTFEASPAMESAFADLGIDYIDLGIHPVRFGPDLFLSMRASRPDMAERIAAHAAAVSADDYRARTYEGPPDLAGSVVFFAQCEGDRALISGGRFCTWRRARAAVVGAVGARNWFVKPHPFGGDNAYVRGALRAGARRLGGNTYDLLATRIPFEPVGLSTSVLTEARAFGYKPRALLPLADSGVPILHDFRKSAFWAYVLHANMTTVVRPEFEPGYLRRAFEISWAFEESN
jgi:hypothetical protein